MTKKKQTNERRSAERRPLLESFSFFVVAPSKGIFRLPVHDLSEGGLGFGLDSVGEVYLREPFSEGETIELHFYLNQSFFIPLSVKIVRILASGNIKKFGSQFGAKNPKGIKAIKSFLKVLDELLDVGQVNTARN